MRALDTLGGTHGFATGANSRGQVVGWAEVGAPDRKAGRSTSATLAARRGTHRWRSTTRVWSSGSPTRPRAEGDVFNERAFIWSKRGGFEPLGTLPGDIRSQGLGINDRGQVVGLSRGEAGLRAFIWEDGVLADLERLAPGYEGRLIFAERHQQRGRDLRRGDQRGHRRDRGVRSDSDGKA